MSEKQNNETLIDLFKKSYQATRKYIIILFVAALSLSPMIPFQGYKETVTAALAVGLLFLLFDIYNQVDRRLVNIETNVTHGAPPYFSDFVHAEGDINDAIVNSLVESNEVELCFLTVSASYSWPLFESVVRQIDKKFGKGNRKITLTICLVYPSHFDNWKLNTWKHKSIVTISNIKDFEIRYRDRIEVNNITINQYLFDNLPHWHGILINNSILYLGRTEWEFPAEGESASLLVGQIEYRKFAKSDRFGGAERIERFMNWIRRYQRRDSELRSSGVIT